MSRLKNKLAPVREEVRAAYRNGATLREIGELYDVSSGTVRNNLIEMGEILRSRGRRKKENTHDPRILDLEPVKLEDTIDPQADNEYPGGAI